MFHHAAKVAFMLLCCMKTIKDVFAEFKQGLSGLYDANESEAITLLAISEISNFSKAKIKAFLETELTEQQTEQLTNILPQLKTGKPIQYILGTIEFYGLPFKVNPSVLIPRPETEELVEWVIKSVGSGQWAVGSGQFPVGSVQLGVGSILDIGTGSGCIAISLKKNLPSYKVSAIDISVDALKTAKENAALNEVAVDFIEADILNPKSDIEHPKSEIIISNPPYVTIRDKTQMHTNVTDFEPHTALFVPEDDPLIFYKAIADFAVRHLSPNGLLFFEINESYGNQIVELLAAKSFQNIQLRKDMSGRDRMLKANR
jgi:release factor glutamine methyltransferase